RTSRPPVPLIRTEHPNPTEVPMHTLLKRLFRRAPRTVRNVPPKTPKACLGLEALEARTLMAASLTAKLNLADGVLRIDGTDNADPIRVVHNRGTLSVQGIPIAVTNGGGTTSVASVPRSQVASVQVTARGGKDLVEMVESGLAAGQEVSLVAYGGTGI